jgi:hypothetical protein
MTIRSATACAFILVLVAASSARARDFEMGSDNQYPYSIMAPEPGTHHPAKSVKTRSGPAAAAPTHPVAERIPRRLYDVRGSSGSVLPTPLPKTQLIPPEGGGRLVLPASPSAQGPIALPGVAHPIPSLPHGAESFQDRASRCSFQAGLYNVPGNLHSQYMGSCVN